MMQVKTIPMDVYVVSAPGAVTVTATVNGVEMTLARLGAAGGQVAFQAVGECVEVSDASAVVLPFVDAPVPLGMDGGVDAVQVARMIADSDGVVHVLYEAVTQSPPEGNLDNYNAYGWAMVVTQSGRLDTVVLQPRSQGTVLDTFPVYLNIFALEGNAWKLLGCSENGVEQSLDTPSVWSFSGVELVAGQKLHVEGSRQKGSEARDARLAARVVANNLADTGIIERNGDVRVTDWVPQYTLSLSRPAGLEARGVELAEEARLEAHTMDEVRHITAAERAAWNGKADTSALAGKVNSATFNAHAGDAVKHVTAAERTAWNGAADSLNTHEQNAGLHLQVADSWSCMFFPGTGSASVTAGVFAGANTSWLSARSDAVTFSANDDGFVYKINTSGAITELRLGEAELQALAALIARKEELLALLPTV